MQAHCTELQARAWSSGADGQAQNTTAENGPNNVPAPHLIPPPLSPVPSGCTPPRGSRATAAARHLCRCERRVVHKAREVLVNPISSRPATSLLLLLLLLQPTHDTMSAIRTPESEKMDDLQHLDKGLESGGEVSRLHNPADARTSSRPSSPSPTSRAGAPPPSSSTSACSARAVARSRMATMDP